MSEIWFIFEFSAVSHHVSTRRGGGSRLSDGFFVENEEEFPDGNLPRPSSVAEWSGFSNAIQRREFSGEFATSFREFFDLTDGGEFNDSAYRQQLLSMCTPAEIITFEDCIGEE